MFRYHTITFTVATLMLAWAVPAGAALDLVEHAHELNARDVTLPVHPSGHVVIRQCTGTNECDVVKLPVDANTVYRLEGEITAVSLSDFRKAARGANKLIYLFYRADDSRVVTRMTLDTDNEAASELKRAQRARKDRSRS